MTAVDRVARTSVNVGGTWYRAGDRVPADVAETVRNTKVFEPVEEAKPVEETKPAPAKRAAKKAAPAAE